MSIGPNVVIPILIVCGVVALVILVVIFFILYRVRWGGAQREKRHFRGYTRRHSFELTCTPSPGIHHSPVCVQLSSSYAASCDILIDVSFTSSPKDQQGASARLLGTDGNYGEHFMLYKDPLEFVEPGRYIVHAHTVYPTLRVVGAVHQFVFDIVCDASRSHSVGSADHTAHVNIHRDALGFHHSTEQHPQQQQQQQQQHGAPLPPRIIPAKGEVTTFTPITIAPHEDSCTPDQIRFSVDGTHPSLLYTGPFTLSVPPIDASNDAQHVPIIVRALAVLGRDEALTSPVVEASLVVYNAGHTFFDPQIPSPVGRIVAKEAGLYFDESRRPRNSKIFYQLVYITEARQKAKFSRRRSIEYDGRPVKMKEDLAYVYAWTLIEDDMDFYKNNHARGERHHLRSSAAVYDCASASTWNRGPREAADTGGDNPTLPPPVICVSCKEIELFFEDPPAGGIICYTLNGTEPCKPDATTTAARMAGIGFSGATRVRRDSCEDGAYLDTHVYRENQPIHVTLLRTEQVFVTARTFIPVADLSAGGTITGYRYGERFHRGFLTQ